MVHDSNARAMPRVFVDVSPINQGDNDWHYVLSISHRLSMGNLSTSSNQVLYTLSGCALVPHFPFPYKERPKSVRGIGNKSNIDRSIPRTS